MILCFKNPFSERQRQPMLETVDRVLVGIEFDVHDRM